MSCWCHVAAVMRIDAIRVDEIEPLDWDELIGKECLWGSGKWKDFEANPDKYLPMGSEGSLRKSVWANPDLSDCAAYTVTIWGDLRDRNIDDAKKIAEWFENKCKQFSIRQAMITINAEFQGTKTYIYNNEKEKLVCIH